MKLSIGTTVRLTNGKTCVVKSELGEGGQGVVYRVSCEGSDYALKWYTKKYPNTFRDNLEQNVKLGAPAPNFIWPLAVTEFQNDSFGYLMKIRPEGYYEMSEFLLNDVRFETPLAIFNACLQIVTAFQKLHALGPKYQDMNDGNFFINPQTGDILVCDNDNVAPFNTGIWGKAGYMAPEIVEHKSMPTVYSDYFSMAVCLFIIIYGNRPFEGAWYLSCPLDNDPKMSQKLFGYDAIFIMDPTNDKNRPVPGIHVSVIKRWPLWPRILREAFCKAFSQEAIRNPQKRLIDKQWTSILLQARSQYVKCPSCGKYTFINSIESKQCVLCSRRLDFPVLKSGHYSIPIVDGQKIYACMIGITSNLDEIIGSVETRGGEVGIVNRSSKIWTVTMPSGQFRNVEPRKGLPAKQGFKIRFGQNETAEII